jgi:hypothetical protein
MENIVRQFTVPCNFREVTVYVVCTMDNGKLISTDFQGCEEGYHNCIKCKKCEEEIINLLQREYQ